MITINMFLFINNINFINRRIFNQSSINNQKLKKFKRKFDLYFVHIEISSKDYF